MVTTVVLCPNCRKQNDDSFNFCIYCGTKLIKNSIKCAKCGKLNKYDSNFCIYCGNKLKQKNNPHVHEKFEGKVENNNSSDLGVIYLGGSTIDDSEIEKDTLNTDSNKVKSKSTDNKQDIDKNLIENLNDTNIKNNDNHKKTEIDQKHALNKIKKEQNNHSNSRNKLKEKNNPQIQNEFEKKVENNNSSDLEIIYLGGTTIDDNKTGKDTPNTNSNKVKSKSTDYRRNIDKYLIEKLYGPNIKNNDNHKKAKIEQNNLSKNSRSKLKEKNNPQVQNEFKENIEFINYSDSEMLILIEKILDDSKNTKEKITETQSEVIILPSVKTINCEFCGNELLNDNSFKICKSCQIRIANYLDLLCVDFEINTEIPLEKLSREAKKHKLSSEAFNDIITTLNKYNYLHKINGVIFIDYNKELRNFIDKYSTKTTNKNNAIENKISLVTEKIGLNTPFDITYLKETLNFKNSEISNMIKYLEEKNAIIEDEDYFILVDKTHDN